MFNKIFLIFVFGIVIFSRSIAQNLSDYQIGVAYTSGKIVKHTKSIFVTPKPYSDNFEINFTQPGTSKNYWQQKFNNPTVGLTFTYINSYSSIIGKIYSIMPTIQFAFIKKNNFQFGTRVGAGMAYATNHWHRFPYNDSIDNFLGSTLNLYASVGLLANYQINKQWQAVCGGTLSHTSNSGTRKPNFGINLLGAYVGVNYHPFAYTLKNKNTDKLNYPKFKNTKNRFGSDVRLGTSMTEYGYGDGPLVPIYSGTFVGTYTIHDKHKLFLGMDYEYNGKVAEFLRDSHQQVASIQNSSTFISTVFGDEITIGRIGIPLQIGIYMNNPNLKPTKASKKFGIVYYPYKNTSNILKGIYFGGLIKANAFNADYLDFCLGASF